MNEFKYNIGYALSGGFIKGFAHLGIMQALHEHGIRPEILSGVSAGALAAVFYADGKEPYHIVELFEHHSFKELTTFSINKQGLLKLDSFIDFLNSNLESKTIEELKIPTIITATDFLPADASGKGYPQRCSCTIHGTGHPRRLGSRNPEGRLQPGE